MVNHLVRDAMRASFTHSSRAGISFSRTKLKSNVFPSNNFAINLRNFYTRYESFLARWMIDREGSLRFPISRVTSLKNKRKNKKIINEFYCEIGRIIIWDARHVKFIPSFCHFNTTFNYLSFLLKKDFWIILIYTCWKFFYLVNEEGSFRWWKKMAAGGRILRG